MKVINIALIALGGWLIYKKFKGSHDADLNRLPSAVQMQDAITAHTKADAAELVKMCKNASLLTAAQKQRVKTIFYNMGFPAVMDSEYNRLAGSTFGDVVGRLFSTAEQNELRSIAQNISSKGIFAIDSANGEPAKIYKSTSSTAPQNLTASGTVKGKSYLGRLQKNVSGYCSYYGNDGNIYWIPQSSAYLVEIK